MGGVGVWDAVVIVTNVVVVFVCSSAVKATAAEAAIGINSAVVIVCVIVIAVVLATVVVSTIICCISSLSLATASAVISIRQPSIVFCSVGGCMANVPCVVSSINGWVMREFVASSVLRRNR